MRKIAVIGDTGAGKTSFSKELSDRLGIEHHDSDAYRFNNGVKRPNEEYLKDIERITARDSWILDSAHTASLPLAAARAEAIFYFRFPSRILLYRVLKRALRRLLTDEAYADGRKEDLVHLVGKDGWISAFYPRLREKRAKYDELVAEIDTEGVHFVVFTHPRQVRKYLFGKPR